MASDGQASDSEYRGFFGILRAMRDMGQVARAGCRPTLPLSVAQACYDAVVDALVDRLGSEFGLHWRIDREAQVGSARRERTYQSRVYVADVALSNFPGWEDRLHAVLADVADLAGPTILPRALGGTSARMPEKMKQGLRDHGVDPGHFDADSLGSSQDQGVVFSTASWFWAVRDSRGGDIQIEVDGDQTVLSAIATVTLP